MIERESTDVDRAATAPTPTSKTPAGEEEITPKRKLSLASELETMTQSGAFLRAVQENRPEVAVCRAILQKAPGRRSLDDIHVLKSLLGTSKLLEFFSNLDAYKVDKLYQSIDIVIYDEKGSIVFEEDDPGENFYMVFRGQIEIRQRDRRGSIDQLSKKPVTQHIAFLQAGDSFGERALLYESDRRAASAFVSSDSAELIFINRHVFTDLLKESHDADLTGTTLEVTKRFRSNKDIIRNIFTRTSAQRSEKDLKFAVEYLKSVKFFARFSFEVRKQLCKAMKLISAVTNTVLFEEGQEGRHFYIIFSGSAEVSVRAKNRFDGHVNNVVSRLGEGEYFGELALSEAGGLRRATVTCADFCELLVLGRDQYEPLIKKYQNEYHAQYAKMLSKNPYFIGPEWDEYTIQAMCAVMAEKYFPFKGEICKQGSRATEMFVITRGECVMIHEGKHPITGQPQQYELGRFGPNSVLGCAEASAGRFNDIFTRDYSVIAESPVRLLVLSRFDIFHLMSANARESLQRSSVGYTRESIESRAVKSVTWERYRKEFLADVLAKKDQASSGGIGAGRGPARMLGKSASTPTLATVERVLKPLVEPGSLVLEPRSTGRFIVRKGPLASIGKRGDDKKNDPQQYPTTSADPKIVNNLVDEAAERRRNTVQSGTEAAQSTPATDLAHRPLRKMLAPQPTLQENGSAGVRTSDDEEVARTEPTVVAPLRQPVRGRRQSLMKSKTFAVLESVAQSPPDFSTMPQQFFEKPLYGAAHPPPASAGSTSPAAMMSSERRRSVRMRSDAALKLPTAAALASSTSAIWTPIHGVCQPFALLGFSRERASSTSGKLVTAANAVITSPKPTRTASAASHSVAKLEAAEEANAAPLVTAFRVFGKFAELRDALDLFRHVCSLETQPPAPDRDTSRFVIYKEDEMTMALENYYGSNSSDAAVGVDGSATTPELEPLSRRPYQYRALDLPQPTGQRFACVGVSVEAPARLAENVAVHVYQCFPTPQSAARFAKQMAAASLATLAPLCVVPLFEWVPLADIERFDARNADLEQALESVAVRGDANGADAPLSTWKARKEAAKKARVIALKRA